MLCLASDPQLSIVAERMLLNTSEFLHVASDINANHTNNQDNENHVLELPGCL